MYVCVSVCECVNVCVSVCARLCTSRWRITGKRFEINQLVFHRFVDRQKAIQRRRLFGDVVTLDRDLFF